MHMQLVQEIRHKEFLQTVNIVDQMSYGSSKLINTLFQYKFNDELD